MFGGIIKVFIL